MALIQEIKDGQIIQRATSASTEKKSNDLDIKINPQIILKGCH